MQKTKPGASPKVRRVRDYSSLALLGMTRENESEPRPIAPRIGGRYSNKGLIFDMFTDFVAMDRWTKKKVHVLYQALIVAIATRHADAVDIKFLVDGRPVWVALPHPAWIEYRKRSGNVITDALAKEIAGHYLKTALESGEGLGREMYGLTIEETLKHLDAVVAEVETPAEASR